MKYAIIIPDGAADEPQESLGGKTPLEAAQTPNMDRVAAMGVVARACHTPPALPAGSEIGNLSLLGYNPFENFTGRAPMEAAAQGIKLGPTDWAMRCNLVTIEDQVMRDFTADHISTEEGDQAAGVGAGKNRQRSEVSRRDRVRAGRQLSQSADLARRRSCRRRSRTTRAPARRTTSPTSRCSKSIRAARGATCCAS